MSNFSELHPSLKPKKGQWLNKRVRYVLGQLGFKTPAKLWGLRVIPATKRMNKDWLRSVYMETYEVEEASAALAVFNMRLPTIELGGGFGAVALAVNRHLARPCEHVVVDIDPDMISLLRQNAALNGGQFKAMRGAVSDSPLTFDKLKHFIGQTVGGVGEEIPVFSLYTMAHEAGPSLDGYNLFMDIEGGEAKVISENQLFIKLHVKHLVLELHGHKADREEIAGIPVLLHGLGFKAVWQRKNVWGFSKC